MNILEQNTVTAAESLLRQSSAASIFLPLVDGKALYMGSPAGIASMLPDLGGAAVRGEAVELTDAQIGNFWMDRDCIEAIRAGDVIAQFVSAFRAGMKALGVSARAADAPSEPSENCNFLCSTFDAKIWADEFCKRNSAADHGMMLGWFANAIMAGFDEANRCKSRAADALDSQPTEWLPTAAAINALPEGVRKYVHNLVANSDPAGTVAHNTLLTDNCENLQVAHRKMADALEEVCACFSAAEAEGLSTALAETSDEGLKDLVERRLMHAFYVAEPFSSQPTDGGVRNG